MSPTQRAAGPYDGTSTLVLGASGFIGRWVLRALHERGAVTHAVVRNPERASAVAGDALGVTVADLAEPGRVTTIVRAIQPAVVFNLAGYGVDHGERDPLMMEALNTGLVRELCEALIAVPATTSAWAGSRLVQAGSALEYGRATGRLSEETTPAPDTDYGRTKLAGTTAVIEAAARAGLRGVVARLFTVYGPGEHAGRLLPTLLAARGGGRVQLTRGAQRRDFTYVEDTIDGLLRLGAAALPAGTLVNLATGRLTSVREFAEIAATVLGLAPNALEFGAVPTMSEEMFHGDVDVSRLEHLLGWRPATMVAEGIRRTGDIDRAN